MIQKYKYYILSFLFLVFAGFILKPHWFRMKLISTFKKNGIELKVNNFEMPYHENSFKMTVLASNDFFDSSIKEAGGVYNIKSIYNNSSEFNSLYINSGYVELKNEWDKEKIPLLPNFDTLSVKDLNVKMNVEDINVQNLYLKDIVITKNDGGKQNVLDISLKGTIELEGIIFKVDAIHQNEISISSNTISISKLRKLNIPLINLIKDGNFLVNLNVNANLHTHTQIIKAIIVVKDFKLKSENEITFIEKIFYANVKDKFKSKDPVSENINIQFELPLEDNDEIIRISNAKRIKSMLLLQLSKVFFKF